MSIAELPSGLTGDVRKITGAEISAIAEQADGQGDADGGFSNLLNGCWTSTISKGPYPNVVVGDAKPDWKRILKGDVIVGVVELRRISLSDGDDFEFDVACEECRKKIQWSKKLSELPLRRLSSDSQAIIASQKYFEIDILKGGQKHRASFQLQTIAQEEPIARLMKQTKRTVATVVDVLCGQIVGIAGVKPDIKARWRFLSELSWGELHDLRSEMDLFDCGIDTEIEIKCQNRLCGWEQTVNIPLLGRRFFSQRRRQKKTVDDDSEQLDSGEGSSEVSPLPGGASDATTSGGTSTGGLATP